MTITYTSAWQDSTETLEQFVSLQFDLWGGEGQLEALRSNVKSQNEAFARLLEALARKQAISAPDITEIVRGFRDDNATLSE